jgi:hypothetical protein
MPVPEAVGSPLSSQGKGAEREGNSLRWLIQLAVVSALVCGISLALKFALPGSNTTQKAFPFMVLLSAMGLVASLWLWFLQKRRTNRAIAGFVLANMLMVALVILSFALATTEFRRANDPKKPGPAPEPSPAETGPVVPAQLAGLGYLPQDCNLVAGIHVAELAALPVGKQLLARQQPGEGERPPWLLDQGVGRVEAMTGLPAAELDHLVFGLRVDTGLPHVTMVVRTRQPYEAAKVAQALATFARARVVPVKYLGKDLYQFKTPPLGAGMLFCADDRTLVLVFRVDALTERDKRQFDEQPRRGAKGPPEPVRPIVEKRLQAGTQVWWAAADLERPEVTVMLLPLGQKDAEVAKLMGNVRALTGGLRLQKDAAIIGSLQCHDGDTARRLTVLLEQQSLAGLGAAKVFGPPPDGSDTWLTFQLQGSPQAVAGALRQVRLMIGPGTGP